MNTERRNFLKESVSVTSKPSNIFEGFKEVFYQKISRFLKECKYTTYF